MPQHLSRLTLVVTDVRIERLQDISEGDAEAEGVETDVWDMAPVARRYGFDDAWFVGWSMGVSAPCVSADADRVARASYQSLWDSINAKRDGGKYAWDKNPWVAAVTFKPVLCNISRMKEAA